MGAAQASDEGKEQKAISPLDLPFDELVRYYMAHAKEQSWGFDPILVIGPTGAGKSRSLINLPPELTAITNTEEQPMPFRGANRFKWNVMPKPEGTEVKRKNQAGEEVVVRLENKYRQSIDILSYFLNSSVPIVVLDSLSEVQNRLDQLARNTFTNFDVMNFYNTKLGELLDMLRPNNKFVIAITHPETIAEVQGEEQVVATTQYKVWKGSIEKKYPIVLYAMTRTTDTGQVEYVFLTNRTEGHLRVTAKSPEGMFNTYEPNDLAVILRKLMLYRMGY